MPLIYSSSWKQTTGISPEEAAERALEMFNLYVNSGNDGECGDMACCDEKVTLHRFNPETGRPEISTDGGETWKSDPADTQNLIPLYPPPIASGVSATKCDAATNASEHINELIDATGENLSTAASVFALAVAVAETILGLFLIIVSAGTLTAPVTAVATAIWAAASGAFSLGIAAYNAYWTVDKKDAILCALYCNIGDNGQFTEAQYQAFRSDIKGTLPASPAFDIVMTAINTGGARGLSQMASYGNAALADCTSCGCDTTCGHNWFIYGTGGTILEQTEDYIIVQAAYWPEEVGGYAAGITTNDNAACCYVTNVTVLSGVTSGSLHVRCGETIPSIGAAWPHTGEPDCHLYTACAYMAVGTAPFTVKITLSDTPCP